MKAMANYYSGWLAALTGKPQPIIIGTTVRCKVYDWLSLPGLQKLPKLFFKRCVTNCGKTSSAARTPGCLLPGHRKLPRGAKPIIIHKNNNAL